MHPPRVEDLRQGRPTKGVTRRIGIQYAPFRRPRASPRATAPPVGSISQERGDASSQQTDQSGEPVVCLGADCTKSFTVPLLFSTTRRKERGKAVARAREVRKRPRHYAAPMPKACCAMAPQQNGQRNPHNTETLNALCVNVACTEPNCAERSLPAATRKN